MQDLTLKDVIGWTGADLGEREQEEFERTTGMQAVRRVVEEHGIPGLWQSTRRGITGNIGALLDISLLDVVRRAWNTTRELARYRDSEKYPPDKTFVVPLAKHTVRSKHTPHLEVRVNEQPIGRIDFSIELEVVFKGLRLHIQDGRIRRIDGGECRGKGSLECGGFQIVRRELSPVKIPGTVDLGDGIAI